MLRLFADENFDNDIVRGVIRREPSVDLVRVQDVGLRGKDDITILEWAIRQNRILLTHDLKTIPRYAVRLLDSGRSIPGVFGIPRRTPIGAAVECLILVIACSEQDEWRDRVSYLPL